MCGKVFARLKHATFHSLCTEQRLQQIYLPLTEISHIRLKVQRRYSLHGI